MKREEFAKKWGHERTMNTMGLPVTIPKYDEFLADLDSLSLPPAEGATDKFRDVLNEVQRYIETNGGATESEMKTIWNSLSCAITESEKRQPPAEGVVTLLSDEEYQKPANQNRDNPIIGYKSVSAQHPTAEGAEEIIESIVESLGDPINIHNHAFEIRPYTVDHTTEWWIFHKEVASGEPLAQWLSKFATLHAQKIADKMVEWISVKDKLPTQEDADEYGKVLIYRETNSDQMGMSKTIYDYAMVKYCDEQTYWMKLPDKP